MQRPTTILEVDHAVQTDTVGAVVHVGAPWCVPCDALNEHLQRKTYPGVAVLYVDAEALPSYAERQNIENVPCLLIYRRESGVMKLVAEIQGAKLEYIDLNLRSLFDHRSKGEFASLDDYLRFLIARDRVMLFITGTPSMPRCGFTGRLVELMEKYNVRYTFFDVWADDEVCQALKTFSDWPTYPHVYVDGELIGGYDICAQLDKEGKLVAALKVGSQ